MPVDVPGLPDAVLVARPGLDREEWLEVRRRGIGGSDVAAICGLSPYTSALAIYYAKRGDLTDGGDSEAARWGRRLEDVVADGFAEDVQVEVLPSPGTLAHRNRPWMLANPDRLAIDPLTGQLAILEIKTRSAWQLLDWEHAVPDGPALQTHWYMAVTGAPVAFVAALVGGNTLRWHRLERDQPLIDRLIAIAETFWADTLHGRAPLADGSERTTHLLARMTTPAATVQLDLDATAPLLARRAALLTRIAPLKELQEQLRAVDNALIGRLGRSEVALAGERPVLSYRPSGGMATKRFRDDQPDLWAKYQVSGEVFDLASFKTEQPELYTAYRSRRLTIHDDIHDGPTKKEV